MGQYYKFVNRTRRQESTISLPFNFGMPWAKSLEYESKDELRQKFDYVIAQNHWAETDEVVAEGDYGNVIDYPEER